MATHSNILAWRIPWTEEPGRLQSMGLQRVGHGWATSLHITSLKKYLELKAVFQCIWSGNKFSGGTWLSPQTLITDYWSQLAHWHKPSPVKQTWIQHQKSWQFVFFVSQLIKAHLLHPHQTEDEHCQDVPPKRVSFCFELHANDRVLGAPCSAREGQPGGSMWDAPCCVPEQLFQSPGFHRKSSKGARCFLCIQHPSRCCVSGDGTHHAHSLKVLCLPHCFRMLHRGVISAVLNSLKKQIFHLANTMLAKPSSSSREKAVWIDLQEGLAQGRADASWVRVHLTCPSPSLLRGPAQFHGSSFKESGARPAP